MRLTGSAPWPPEVWYWNAKERNIACYIQAKCSNLKCNKGVLHLHVPCAPAQTSVRRSYRPFKEEGEANISHLLSMLYQTCRVGQSPGLQLQRISHTKQDAISTCGIDGRRVVRGACMVATLP